MVTVRLRQDGKTAEKEKEKPEDLPHTPSQASGDRSRQNI